MRELPPNALFSTLAFMGFLLAVVPFPLHIQTRNTGMCINVFWASLGCLILFINSVVWNDNVTNRAPVWCDISARYIVGGSVGISASAFCTIRRLYYATRLERVSVRKEERRHEIMVDVSIGIGLPCIVMTLEYIVQEHRFDILEQIGCFPSIVNSLATYFLIFLWPLALGSIGLIYAFLTFRASSRLRWELKDVLHTNFPISTGYYWRLMILCSVKAFFTIPATLIILLANLSSSHLDPYTSWVSIHSGISRIGQYPTAAWQSTPSSAIRAEVMRWQYIFCAFLISGFFGWGKETRDFYRPIFWSVSRHLGYSAPSNSPLLPLTSILKRSTQDGPELPPVDGINQQMRSELVSVSIQNWERRHFSRSSLLFEEPLDWGSSHQLSVDEGLPGRTPELLPSKNLTHHSDIRRQSIVAIPEPALDRDFVMKTSRTDVSRQSLLFTS